MNKPVAWMYEDASGTMKMLGNTQLEEWVTKFGCKEIPLYTHPVKEQDTDCQYCKQGCIRCDARKQLTDEEIIQVMMNVYSDTVPPIRGIDFAKAILRKAQEQ